MTDPLNRNARVAPGEDRWHPAGEDWTVPVETLDREDRLLRAAILELPDGWLPEDVVVECVQRTLPVEDATAMALILELVDEGLLAGVSGGMKRKTTGLTSP